MATKVPYEDVQSAARCIAQCATNVLTVSNNSVFRQKTDESELMSLKAVNGPLQQRTVTLDLDASRANRVPADYDTDPESPWANPSTYS